MSRLIPELSPCEVLLVFTRPRCWLSRISAQTTPGMSTTGRPVLVSSTPTCLQRSPSPGLGSGPNSSSAPLWLAPDHLFVVRPQDLPYGPCTLCQMTDLIKASMAGSLTVSQPSSFLCHFTTLGGLNNLAPFCNTLRNRS